MHRSLPLLATLLFTSAAAGACGGCSHTPAEVPWPASAETTMEGELLASAPDVTPPLLPDGTRASVALPADAPGVHAHSFVYRGLWVAEVVLGDVPGDPREAELPLVVMLHGRGDRPRIPGGPFGRVPTPMRVLIPRGPMALGGGYAWARFSVTEASHHDELAADLLATAERLVALIRHVERTRPTVGTPIITGFSQGGILAWTVALRHPAVVGLAIPIAGWVPPGARPTPLQGPGVPIQSTHGTADPIVRIERTRDLVGVLRRHGYSVEWVEEDGVAHQVSPAMNARFEDWLEAALEERAPALIGGLGVAGPDPEPLEPYEEPLELDPEEEAEPAPLPADVVEEASAEEEPDGDAAATD